MTFEEIEAIAKPMLEIADIAAKKRIKFRDGPKSNLVEEQALGEAIGASKCIQVLVGLYPDEMGIITAAQEA